MKGLRSKRRSSPCILKVVASEAFLLYCQSLLLTLAQNVLERVRASGYGILTDNILSLFGRVNCLKI